MRIQTLDETAILFPHENHVLYWFVYWANKHGTDDAFFRLRKLLTGEAIDIRVTSDLVGINYQSDIGVEISGSALTVESVLKNPDHYSLTNYILYPDSGMNLGYYPTHAVSFVRSFSLGDLAPVLAKPREIESLQSDNDLLSAFCMAATLNGHGQVSQDWTKWTLNELPCLAVFSGALVSRHHNTSRTKGDGFGVEKDAIAEIERDATAILKLEMTNYDRLKLALRQLSLSKGEASIEEQYLYSASALEVILGAEGDQISFQVRLFGAMIAETDFDKRQEVFDQLKRVYAQRSRVIHSGKTNLNKTHSDPNPSELASLIIKNYLRLGMPSIKDYIMKCQPVVL